MGHPVQLDALASGIHMARHHELVAESTRRGDALDALLRAGELECALLDEGERAARELAEWTDAAADALVRGERLAMRPTPAIERTTA